LGCGLKWSMQHLSSYYRAGGVDNEAKKILYSAREGRGLGSLGER
jgi:hypothetical protein